MMETNARPTYKRLEYELPAGGMVKISRSALQVTCLEASAPFRVQFNGGSETEFEAGLSFRNAAGFYQTTIRNPGAASITIALGFSNGDVTDARIAGQIGTVETMPDTLTSGAPKSALDGATTTIIPANTARREAIVTNMGAGVIFIYGYSSAAAGMGLPLQAGQSITLQTTAAIYARNDSGAAVNVAWAELERS